MKKTLIIMCYREAIDSLKRGMDCRQKKALEQKTMQFNRARDIISELLSSLNMEAGSVIAQNLSSIYNFLLRHILEGDIKENMKAIEEAIGILTELKSAWEDMGIRGDLDQELRVKPVPERSQVSLSVGI